MRIQKIFCITSLLVSFATAAESKPASANFTFHFHGGAVVSYVDDHIKITPSTSELKTISPFPYTLTAANQIGYFEAPTTQDVYARIQALAAEYLKSPQRNVHIPNDAVVVEFAKDVGGKTVSKTWSLGGDPEAAALEKYYFELKKNIKWSAKAALRLICKTGDPGYLQCAMENTGSASVTSIDPTVVNASLVCPQANGRRAWLNRQTELDPNKMHPKVVTIAAKDSYTFKVRSDSSCTDRVVMKTSDMLISKEYQSYLLGELISNSLAK